MTSPSSSDPLLTDRTTIETDWECGMRRWWYKHEGGTGIVPKEEAVWFRQGRDYHSDFADLAESADPLHSAVELIASLEEKIRGTTDQLAQEELTRRAGWIAANALYLEPATRRDYLTLGTEHELVLERDPLWVAVTPDRVLERKSDGRVIVRDYKGVGGWGIGKAWLESWPYAIQMHTLIKAVAEELGREVGYAQVVGLSKGQERDGRLRHPYVWGWWTPDGTPVRDYYEAKKKGLDISPVWEYPQGILEWVRKLGQEEASSQFAFSPPIYYNERLLEDLVRSRTRREREVKLFKTTSQHDRQVRMLHFEPRFSKCRPAIGSPCPYLAACHLETVNRDPLASGQYIPRTPHHDLERIGGLDNDNDPK